MSEFSICLQDLTQQKTRIILVEDAIRACKKMVDGVNSGLGLIGIGGVGNALSAISGRLMMHAKKCESLSTALIQIIRKYQYAENTIAGTKTIQQILEELVQAAEQAFQPIEQPDYVGAIYLVNNEGAAKQGHAAVVLVRADGSYEYYSYGSDFKNLAFDVLVDHRYGDWFFQSGILDTDIHDKNGFDEYSNYVFIPIDDEAGQLMHNQAQEILANPEDYNLLTNNCNMNAQAILEAGGVSFAPTDFDFVATRPNTVYEQFLATVQANPDLYHGYVFGEVTGGDLSWLESGEIQSLINHDVTVSPITDVSFYDPGEGVENFLNDFGNSVFGGTNSYEVSQYWNQGLSGDWQSDANFVLDHGQGAGDYVVDTVQTGANTGIDWVQDNIISHTGFIGDGVNVVIDGAQWAGNGVIDGAQWVGDKVVDGVQWVGNKVIDGAEAIGDFWDTLWS